MAARDRFGAFGDAGPSPLQRYIQSACDPQNYEPNLALDLEIADLINSKKGNAPREAAVAIVNYINHRNPNVSLLALTLLDICVKNCGYPFHLQIGTKEFLNELVRRFPERPPVRPSRVQLKILEEIEEWRVTICQNSRYKEDLGFIRDMHRLLSYKGYVFPEVRREDAAVLNPSDSLKSADEMEEEERAAQSAKLQELIRRGGPDDLQEANRLMKVMAGYDTKHKTDYRAKAAEEVGKVQQKARILEEMLQGYQEGDAIKEGDVFQELANALQSAQPKIQKMCEEESDDSEAVAKLLEINDSIHRTVQRYKLIKAGDVDAAAKIPKGTLGTSTGVGKTADNELSLIDFGGDNDAEPNGAGESTSTQPGSSGKHPGPKTEALEDDLLGLSFQDGGYGQGGGIALGLGASMNAAPSPGRQMLSSVAPPTPQYSAFSSMSGSRPTSQSVTPTPVLGQQQAQQAQATSTQSSHPVADPFAAIASIGQRQASPSPFQSLQASSQPAKPSSSTQNSRRAASSMQGTSGAPADADEWTFASSLPESSAEIIVTADTVNIVLAVSRAPGADVGLSLLAKFTNTSASAISDLTFQVAVTKGLSLRLKPQSGRVLLPNQRNGITQEMFLEGVQPGRASMVKMRWKMSYTVGGQSQARQGEVSSLGEM
ncbi:MAG: hypothetical protein M1832_001079 [Thelocarpon impressellum]|nr:MAG: hypothetical protein M1832_001079 [Thelocarpon impressellum]